MRACYYAMLYDADDNLLDIVIDSCHLEGKEENDVVLEELKSVVPAYDHYKIIVQAKYTKRGKKVRMKL